MWNAMKTKSLVGAVLITATIQGSLLWGIDHLATASASGISQANVGSLAATATELSLPIQHATLEPVLIVGKRDLLLAEGSAAHDDEVAPDTQVSVDDTEPSGSHI